MSTAALIALATLLQTIPAATPQAGPVEDVRRMAASTSNEARFDVLTTMLRSRGLAFVVEPFTIEKPLGREPRTEGRNVVVTLGGGPDVVDVVLIGAHYDAARLADGSLSQGAVDNAASSVMLVRLADALRAEALAARIKIVWFDMEELGLVGSAQYVKMHGAERIGAMLNFDINAYGNTIVFGPSELKENAALRRRFVETCAAEDIACASFAQMPPGDDRSFVKAGVPTISIGIVSAVEAHQLWLMLHAGASSGLAQGTVPPIMRTIHTSEDGPDKVNEETMLRMQRFALTLVRNVVRR